MAFPLASRITPFLPLGFPDLSGTYILFSIRGFETGKLADYLSFRSDEYPFLIDPMPNLYFTRDPFATIGTGVSLHRMHTVTRNRETLFGKY